MQKRPHRHFSPRYQKPCAWVQLEDSPSENRINFPAASGSAVAIARAVVNKPRLLLLDESSLRWTKTA